MNIHNFDYQMSVAAQCLTDHDAVLIYVVLIEALVIDEVLIVSDTKTRHANCRV